MIKSEWFELPLERQLTIHKINTEIDECRDLSLLRENMKSLVEQNARFQHMISEMLRSNLTSEVARIFKDSKIEEKKE